jgi:hypothetical protein
MSYATDSLKQKNNGSNPLFKVNELNEKKGNPQVLLI